MNETISPAARAVLGIIVTVTATGEYARARLAFGEGSEHAGMVEIGMADGTKRYVTAMEIAPAQGFPIQMRAIPVYPDAADGSSRPMGLCQNEGCGLVESNVIDVVATKGARYTCGDWYVKRGGRDVKAPTATVCTHCYAQGRTPFSS
ncbi:hypothetical protein FNV58_01040 (plasmid) [Streptomyces sp. RLB1-9]|uniref:hypothetical protein n=1 Tax=Streptomyces sp. RLB1-9 TaxID=2594454 RepID=UPI0011655955|nr:hypothetical protein [Streptomyces sp. RLB1-9]QDN94946.1 hypothetical protein FNV58_01040 [Streptomyces sp. RLB1-9]